MRRMGGRRFLGAGGGVLYRTIRTISRSHKFAANIPRSGWRFCGIFSNTKRRLRRRRQRRRRREAVDEDALHALYICTRYNICGRSKRVWAEWTIAVTQRGSSVCVHVFHRCVCVSVKCTRRDAAPFCVRSCGHTFALRIHSGACTAYTSHRAPLENRRAVRHFVWRCTCRFFF